MKTNSNPLNEVIGFDKEKSELMKIADMFRNEDKYIKNNVKRISALLLLKMAPMDSRVLECKFAEACNLKILRTHPGMYDDLKDKILANNDNSPTLYAFENIDTIPPQAGSIWMKLAEIFELSRKQSNSMFVATANNLLNIPADFYKAYFEGNIITIDPPTHEDVADMIDDYFIYDNMPDDVNYLDWAKIMDDKFSYSLLDKTYEKAKADAIYSGSNGMKNKHFTDALVNIAFAITPGDRAPRNVIAHEAGHCVVAEALAPGSSCFITATRGVSNGNYIRHLDETCDDIEIIKSTIKLGGLAGDNIVNDVMGTVGALPDMMNAYDEIGNWFDRGGNGDFTFLHTDDVELSDITKHQREMAIAEKLKEQYALARKIIMDNMEFFNRLIKALEENDYLTYSEIMALKS